MRVNSPVFIQPTPTIKFPASQSQNDTLNTLPGVPMCFQLQLNDLDETGKIDIKTIKEILSTDSMIYQYTLQTIDNGINICLSTNCGYPPYLTTILLPVSDSGQCGQLFNWEDTVWIQTQACNINFPNVFTPNQDGINDLFQPFELNGVTIISLEIYDRWGHQIYEDRLSPISWDGLNTQRKLASEGIYFYVFTYKETGIIPTRIQIKRGQVTLLR